MNFCGFWFLKTKKNLKNHSPPSSSAPLGRLFSAAGQILLLRRNRLSDNLFEVTVAVSEKLNFSPAVTYLSSLQSSY